MYALTRILPPALRPYAKAIYALLATIVATAITWADTGVFNDAEIRTAIVGLVASLLVYAAPNTPPSPTPVP